MKNRDVYVKKVQAQLDEWDADIKKLKAKANKASANATLEYKSRIESLKRKQQEAGDRLDDLKSASDDAWDDLKKGLENATSVLGDSIKSAAAHF